MDPVLFPECVPGVLCIHCTCKKSKCLLSKKSSIIIPGAECQRRHILYSADVNEIKTQFPSLTFKCYRQ